MGRGKITLKCIQNKRDRKSTFMQRVEGLKKKMSKFSDMCGVEACLIVYEGNGDSRPTMTWPQDPVEVHSIIQRYEVQKNEKPLKNFDLEDFFKNRKNMVEAQISKVQKDILKIKYPTWDPIFKNLDEEHVMKFIAMLDTKIAACKQRIDMLKNNQHTESNFNFGMNMAQSESVAFASNPSQLNFMQNMSQIQLIPTSMMPLNHNNQLAPYILDHDVGSQSQMLPLGPQMPRFDPNITRLIANNDGMVDSTNQVDVSLDCTKQNGVIADSTNQLDELMDWAKFGEFENWTSQPGDLVDWTSQLHESSLQTIPSQSQNVPHPQLVHTLPTTVDEFLTDDDNNVLQVQLFNHVNEK